MLGTCAKSYVLCVVIVVVIGSTPKYMPTWVNLDTRPLPKWYDDAKFGIFIHWGVYSVPGYGSEWFWKNWHDGNPLFVQFMKENYAPGFSYADFAKDFKAEFFDAEDWAQIIVSSGAKYVVLTSKHHDGFTLWPSKYSFNWNSADVGPRRDIVWELERAIRTRTHLRFGLYYSLYEFFHPLYLFDQSQNFTTQLFVTQKTIPELYDLVDRYKPDVLWSDGGWVAQSVYWKSTDFLAWLYNQSPVKSEVVVNDRWGKEVSCKHGDFYTCEDNFRPGYTLTRKWENCMTIDKHSWGYRRNAKLNDYKTTVDLIKELVETISCGGNLLLNVGPTSDGMIPVLMVERLESIGYWLRINGEAIYSTTPWTHQKDSLTPNVWYTSRCCNDETIVYAFGFEWPVNGILNLGVCNLTNNSVIVLLGSNCTLQWNNIQGGIAVTFPNKANLPFFIGIKQYVWCLKLTNVYSEYNQSMTTP